MAADLARLAFETALRSLDKQEGLLNELRTRTGLLLAASSLAASFLGGRALGHANAFVVGSTLLAFALSLGASLYVLLPRRDLVFSLAGPNVFEELFAFAGDMSEVHRRLAYDLQRFWENNDVAMARLFWGFRVAAAALAAEIALLLAAASGTLL